MPGGQLKGALVAARARNRLGERIEGSAAFGDAPADNAFESAGLQAAGGIVLDGQVVLSCQDLPLVVTANRGRGRWTALLFSPEREPFRSWKNLPVFWAKLTEVPAEWYGSRGSPGTGA